MMRRVPLLVALFAFGAAGLAVPASAQAPPVAAAEHDGSSSARTGAAAAPRADGAAWFGRSGALRAAVVRSMEVIEPPLVIATDAQGRTEHRWVPVVVERPRLLGDPVLTGPLHAPSVPGVWRLEPGEGAYASAQPPLTVIVTVPFEEKQGGVLNGYRIGSYPTEGSDRTDRYAPPAGFIEVTPGNQDLAVSEHFSLRQFLTKDQFDVWPKYLALDLRLVDKLELVLQELNAMGVRAKHMHVMSGFRTPQYNGPGGDGRAALSRHMYGDAADVWVDNDGDGYIDDLNGDGRRDIADAEVILRAVERVERKHPDLVGGAGLYEANSAHGPFVHVDVRGSRSRW